MPFIPHLFLHLSLFLSHSVSLYLSILLTFQQAYLILHAVNFTLRQSWIQHLRFDWEDISN